LWTGSEHVSAQESEVDGQDVFPRNVKYHLPVFIIFVSTLGGWTFIFKGTASPYIYVPPACPFSHPFHFYFFLNCLSLFIINHQLSIIICLNQSAFYFAIWRQYFLYIFYNLMLWWFFNIATFFAELVLFLVNAIQLTEDCQAVTWQVCGVYHWWWLVTNQIPQGPVPVCSSLIYNPYRRWEAWRFLTYSLSHVGYIHIISNIIVQLALGNPLELFI
jgi:membrane associated rhomboid family serine protease